jgi:hypothetical protein
VQIVLTLLATGSLLKLLVIPLGVGAFLCFLLVLGAFGLFVALGLIAGVSRVFRFVMRTGPPERSAWPR